MSNIYIVGERTDTSADCGNVELLALLHVRLNGWESGGAGISVHDGAEGLEGSHDGGRGIRHILLPLSVIECGLDDDQSARGDGGEEGADGDGPGDGWIRTLLKLS